MVTKLSFLFVSFRVKPCEIKIKKWNQFWIETVLLDNFCQKAHFFLDQFLSKTVLLANFCEKAHTNSFTGLDSFTETVQKNWTVSLKLSKIWKYKNHKIRLKIWIWKKTRDYKAWNSPSNCIEKNVITSSKLTCMQKNKKNSFKTWKIVTILKNWQHFFDISDFFCQC